MDADEMKDQGPKETVAHETTSDQPARQETGLPPKVKRGLIIGSITAAVASLTVTGIAAAKFFRRRRRI